MQSLIRPRPRNAAAAERTPDKPYEFSLARIGNSPLSALLLLLALALALSPLFLPDPLTPRLIVASVRHLRAFRLQDELHEGLFAASDRSGDTRPSQTATAAAYAAYALAVPELSVPTSPQLKSYATALLSNVKDSVQDRYEAAVIARGAGVLTPKDTAALLAGIQALREAGSGFRADIDHAATLSATAQALGAMEALGHDQAFRKSPAFAEVVAFVRSLKDAGSGGFRDAFYAAPSLSATYDALAVLKQLPREELVQAIGLGTEQFVFSCQAEDGGFREFPLPAAVSNGSVSDAMAAASNVTTTAKAVHILQFFEDRSLPASAPPAGQRALSALARSTENAADYLRACLSLSHGVRESYASPRRSLEGTLLFLRLASDLRGMRLGIPPSLPSVLVALAALAATAALLLLYVPQLSGPVFSSLIHRSLVIGVLLSVSVALLGYAPLASLFGFIPLGFYVALRFYEANEQDTQDGLSLLCATINGIVMGGAVYAFNRWAPLLWLQLRAYTTIALVFAAASYVTTLGVCYFNNVRRMQISLNGAVLSWIVCEALVYGWVFGRSDALSSLAYRALGARGYFPLVFWALPFLSWVAALASAALATYTVAFVTGRVKNN